MQPPRGIQVTARHDGLEVEMVNLGVLVLLGAMSAGLLTTGLGVTLALSVGGIGVLMTVVASVVVALFVMRQLPARRRVVITDRTIALHDRGEVIELPTPEIQCRILDPAQDYANPRLLVRQDGDHLFRLEAPAPQLEYLRWAIEQAQATRARKDAAQGGRELSIDQKIPENLEHIRESE